MSNQSGIGFRISLIVNNDKQSKYLIFINLEKHLLVRDVIQHVRDTLSLKSNFKIFINDCLLPEAESIFVIQPGDTLNVCFDNNNKTNQHSNQPHKLLKNKFNSGTLDGVGDCLKLLLEKKSELEKDSITKENIIKENIIKVPVGNSLSKHVDDHSENYDITMVDDSTSNGSLVNINATPTRKRKRTRSKKKSFSINMNGAAEVSDSVELHLSDRKNGAKLSSGQHIYFNEENEKKSPVNASLPSINPDKENELDWRSTLLNLTSKSAGQKIFDRNIKSDSILPIADKAVPINEISQLLVGGTILFQVLTISDDNSPVTSSRIVGKVNSINLDDESVTVTILENKEVFESKQWKSLKQDTVFNITETEEIQLNWLDLIKPTFC